MTRPYRLIGIDSDLQALQRRLAAGRPSRTVDGEAEPLLPGSTAPAIVAARERLQAATGAPANA